MNRSELLEQLCVFTEKSVQDEILPVRLQAGDTKQQFRPADVYKMRLPDGTSATKKAPYILHQIITGKDYQNPGEKTKGTTAIRSIFCVYCDDEQEGSLMLLNLLERVRIQLLRQVVLDKRFQLDLEAGLETLIYPDAPAPYYLAEMMSTWKIPPVEREIDPKWRI